MKKLMVATIILLPLLILAIMLVSGAIMSLVTHIYVESVEFVDDNTVILVMKDEAEPPTKKLEVNVFPLRAKNKDLLFSSADESIVTIDNEGVVTARYYGETSVSVASKENVAAKSELKVLVTDNTVHFVKIHAENEGFGFDMYNGDPSVKLLAQVLPSGANNQDIEWTSSLPEVLSVSPLGEITCHGASEEPVVITARSLDKPEVYDTVEVTCREHIIGISTEGGIRTSITARGTAQFPKIIPMPADATYSVTYSSSDEGIATVDPISGEINFKTAGFVTITATAKDRDNTCSTSVGYDFTDGYYTDIEFEQDAYTFDYDESKGVLDEIKFKPTLDGSYRLIEGATFSREGILSFDAETQKFTLLEVDDSQPLGAVTVTLNVKRYYPLTHEVKEGTDECTVYITRKTQSVSFNYNGAYLSEISLTELTPPQRNIVADEMIGDSICVIATPANHTDTLRFAVDEDSIAAIGEGGVLQFHTEGSVQLSVSADDRAFENTLKVQYVKIEASDKTLSVTPSEEAPRQELNFVLDETAKSGVLQISVPEGTKPKFTLTSKTEGVEVDEIATFHEDTYVIEKHRGGFFTINVTFESIAVEAVAAEEPQEIEILVYVDMPIKAGNVSLYLPDGTPINENYLTSKESIDFKVILGAYDLEEEGKTQPESGVITADYMEGKELYINGVQATLDEHQDVEGKLVFSASEQFKGDFETLDVVFKYDDMAKAAYKAQTPSKDVDIVCSVTRKVNTTHGKLSVAPSVTKDGEQLGSLHFGDLNERITLKVSLDDIALSPADFEFASETISESIKLGSYSDLFTYEVAYVDKHNATVTLTAQKSGQADAVTMNVAGQIVKFAITVDSLADEISLSFGSKALSEDSSYTTFMSALKFTVAISRSDKNADISRNKVFFKLGEGDNWLNAEMNGTTGTISFDNLDGTKVLHIKAEGDKATFDVTLKQLMSSDVDFKQLHVEYNTNKASVSLDPIAFGANAEYVFPKTMQGSFKISISVPELYLPAREDHLSGFDAVAISRFDNYFAPELPSEWTHTLSASSSGDSLDINVTIPSNAYFTGSELKLHCGESVTTALLLSRFNIARVEFNGYDMGVDDNVHKGYQQVRVFAKHSYYGSKVDYLTIPVSALSEIGDSPESNVAADINNIVWQLTVVDSKSNTQSLIVRQVGNTVFFGGKTYVIVPVDGARSKLCEGSESGTVIAEGGVYKVTGAARVPWVDVHSGEDGNVDIYFGCVDGLSEVDVQNDYFGNFDEKPDYQFKPQVQDDNSGRSFAPSEKGAYKYLRVSAGDGAEGGVNTYFNFNILDDDNLVNVFDAEGYYKNKSIVLHNTLYGGASGQQLSSKDVDEEAPKDTPESQFIRQTSGLDKDLIYGNGYAVCYNARNEQLKRDMGSNIGNYGGVGVRGVYNAILRGRNPSDSFNEMDTGVVFVFQYCYYSNIQHYYKCSPYGAKSGANNTGKEGDGGISYFKNSVISKAIKGIQLYYTGAKVYFENMMIYDCVMAVCCEGTGGTGSGEGHLLKAIFQGEFNDVLNYQTLQSLMEAMSKVPLAGFLADTNVWINAIAKYAEWLGKTGPADMIAQHTETRRFINPVVFACFYNTSGDRRDLIKRLNEVSVSGSDLIKAMDIYNNTFSIPAAGWTYSADLKVDGGQSEPAGYEWKAQDRDLSKYLTGDRYIRVLCEYIDIDADENPIKNTQHIMWHMNRVYRDPSLLGEQKSHIEDLRDSLKQGAWDKTWPDGTKLQDVWDAEAQAAAKQTAQAASDLLATALPGKRDLVA